nr:MAG TPA: hypothetical protein [Caudoviricetes sp.]
MLAAGNIYLFAADFRGQLCLSFSGKLPEIYRFSS